jgi:hypothetical protein
MVGIFAHGSRLKEQFSGISRYIIKTIGCMNLTVIKLQENMLFNDGYGRYFLIFYDIRRYLMFNVSKLLNPGQPVYYPKSEPWGMRSSYVADPDGNLIEIGSWGKGEILFYQRGFVRIAKKLWLIIRIKMFKRDNLCQIMEYHLVSYIVFAS